MISHAVLVEESHHTVGEVNPSLRRPCWEAARTLGKPLHLSCWTLRRPPQRIVRRPLRTDDPIASEGVADPPLPSFHLLNIQLVGHEPDVGVALRR